MDWYITVLTKYADFGGRAQRKEFWMFFLFNLIISGMFAIIDEIIGSPTPGILERLYGLFIFIPWLAVFVRRLHDTGKSGWSGLMVLIPLIGPILLFLFLIQDSDTGNKYGPNPKILG